MAYQPVDIGAAPNDGTGDPIRDAFDKCNDNFVELYAGLVGLLDFKGSQDCSANPNYPAASKGDFYLVSVAGKIGGASGIVVSAGDTFFALADNAGGTQASVGTSWTVIQGNVAYTPVNLAGDTMTGDLIVPDEAYDATNWNGSLEVPTKNAVRDKIEAIIAAAGYTPGGTDVALADGGTGASLSDPNADRILFWDDSAGQVTWLAPGTNLSITGTSIDASGGGGSSTAWKDPVRVATVAAGTLASSFENGDTVDGVVLATSDRILIKDQATASENGIYTVNASGAPTRATDADAGSELVGATVFVSEGDVNKDTLWSCTNNATITVNTTGLVFARLGAGWRLAGTNSPSAVANVDFTNLSGYSELLVIGRALTASVSGVRMIQVSTNNGSSFDTTAANYQTISTAGVEANAAAAAIAYHTTGSTSARTLVAHIKNLKGAVKWASFKGSDTDIIYVGSANDIDAIRVTNSAGGNISGGPIYVYGR